MTKQMHELSLEDLESVSGGDDFSMDNALAVASAQLELAKGQSQATEQANGNVKQVGTSTKPASKPLVHQTLSAQAVIRPQ